MASIGVSYPPDILQDRPEAAIRRLYSWLYALVESLNSELHGTDVGIISQAEEVLKQVRQIANTIQTSSAAQNVKTSQALKAEVTRLDRAISDLSTQTASDLSEAITAVQDAIYPIGSVYLSTTGLPPDFGTWVRISNGKYIATGDPGITPANIIFNSNAAGDTTIETISVAAYRRTA